MNLAEAMDAFSKKVSLYKNIGGETFTEYHNGAKIADSFFDVIDENGKTCLQTFFGMWLGYQNQECLRHEEFDHFSIGDIGVTVKVDFVGRMPDGNLVLTDWKTGRDDDDYETELQMAAYVLWAMHYYRKSPDEIRTELVFLKTGAKKSYSFFWEQVFEVQEMIPREFAAMNASYEYENFPASPSQRECMSCKFAEVCPESAIKRK
jgi:hypothetical protein